MSSVLRLWSPRIVKRLIVESEKCQRFQEGSPRIVKAFNWGVREMSEVHEGSPRIVKAFKKRIPRNRKAFKSGVQEMVNRLIGESN